MNELNASQLKKKSIHLPWYKTQWGAGLILGLELGLMSGIPIAFIIYRLAVVVVNFIEGV